MEPIFDLLPPVPDEFMNSIFWNCTKYWGWNCEFRNKSTQYTIICVFCLGHSWTNVASDDGIAESSEVYDYEIDPIVMLTAYMTVDDNYVTEIKKDNT